MVAVIPRSSPMGALMIWEISELIFRLAQTLFTIPAREALAALAKLKLTIIDNKIVTGKLNICPILLNIVVLNDI